MPNISKILIDLIISLLCIFHFSNCNAQCDEAKDHTELKISEHDQKSNTCVNGRNYVLAYDYDKYQISVTTTNPDRKVILEKIHRRYDPRLVGGKDNIRFLPIALQPYLKQNILIYLSSIRTTGVNGGGQCGSGIEVSLNVLDISPHTPKLLSSHLIISCKENIYLDTDATSNCPQFYAFSVVAGQLKIKFMFYKNETSRQYPSAVISRDFMKLEFTDN